MVKNVSRIIALMLVSSTISASQLVFQFHSPSFSGIGQSSHYLTIENLEKSRKQSLIDKAEAEERRLDNDLIRLDQKLNVFIEMKEEKQIEELQDIKHERRKERD